MTLDLFDTPQQQTTRPEDLFCQKLHVESIRALQGYYREEDRDSYRTLIGDAVVWANSYLCFYERIRPRLEGSDPYLIKLWERRVAMVRDALAAYERTHPTQEAKAA